MTLLRCTCYLALDFLIKSDLITLNTICDFPSNMIDSKMSVLCNEHFVLCSSVPCSLQSHPFVCLRGNASAFLCTRLLFYSPFHKRDYYFVFPWKDIYIGYFHTKIFIPSVRISMHLLAKITTREIKFILLLVGREICPARRLFCLIQCRYHRQYSHEEQIMLWWLSFANRRNEKNQHYENIDTDISITPLWYLLDRTEHLWQSECVCLAVKAHLSTFISTSWRLRSARLSLSVQTGCVEHRLTVHEHNYLSMKSSLR
jgi:hypothetical protein